MFRCRRIVRFRKYILHYLQYVCDLKPNDILLLVAKAVDHTPPPACTCYRYLGNTHYVLIRYLRNTYITKTHKIFTHWIFSYLESTTHAFLDKNNKYFFDGLGTNKLHFYIHLDVNTFAVQSPHKNFIKPLNSGILLLYTHTLLTFDKNILK